MMFLLKASYTAEGTRALLAEGGSIRRSVVQRMVTGMGGRLEAFYYALGEADVYVIAELPDTATATAISLVVNASGAARCSITVLVPPEEIDAASKKSVSYRPPGAE